MNEAQRQVRLMTAMNLITEAVDAIDARTRTAYAVGYIDGLLDEGQISVHNAQNQKTIAKSRRDMRLSDLGATPVSPEES